MQDPNRPYPDPNRPYPEPTDPYQSSPGPYQDPNRPYPEPAGPYPGPTQPATGPYQEPPRPYQEPTGPSRQPATGPHQEPPRPYQQPAGPHQNPTGPSQASKLSPPKVMSVRRLINNRVMNPVGEELGIIEELMIDLDAGRIAYAVLSFSRFLGLSSKLFAIPWNALTLSTHDKTFILNVEKEVLKKAPGFDKNHWPDMADPRWSADIHSYYGHQPYQ